MQGGGKGRGEGDASSSNEMPRLELKRTGEGDGEEGIVDNSLRADEEKGEKKRRRSFGMRWQRGRLSCD